MISQSKEMPSADWYLKEYGVFFSDDEMKLFQESYSRTISYVIGDEMPKNLAQAQFIANIRPGGIPKSPAERVWAKFYKLNLIEKKLSQTRSLLRNADARDFSNKQSLVELRKELNGVEAKFKERHEEELSLIKKIELEKVKILEAEIKSLNETVEKIKEREKIWVEILQKALPHTKDELLMEFDKKHKDEYENIRIGVIKKNPKSATEEDIKFLAKERFYWRGVTHKELREIKLRIIELGLSESFIDAIDTALQLLTPNKTSGWSRENAFVEYSKTDGQ